MAGAVGSILVAIGETCIAEARADRQHAPMRHVLHVGDFAETLHHRVIVHDHIGPMTVDPRQHVGQHPGQVEVLAFPVAWQILSSPRNDAALVDETRAGDADERRELQLLLFRAFDQVLEHRD